MLYATTRNNCDAYTAQRVLTMKRGSDGGLIVPYRIPRFSEEEILALGTKSFNRNLADTLNLLFNTRLTGYDDIPGTWTLDGETITVNSNGAIDTYTFDGESVTAASTDGMSMIYGRTPAVKPVYGEVAIKADAVPADFYGSWFCMASEAGGQQIPPVMAGMTLAMSIDAYDAVCVFLVDEYNIGWVGGTGAVENGQMVIDVTSAQEPTTVTLRMYEDGVIAYDEGEGGEKVTYYFQQTNEPVIE